MRDLAIRLSAILFAAILIILTPRMALANTDYWLRIETAMILSDGSQGGEELTFHEHGLPSIVVGQPNDDILPPTYRSFVSSAMYAEVNKGTWVNGEFIPSGIMYFTYAMGIADQFVVGERPDPTGPMIGPPLSDSDRDELYQRDVVVHWTPWFWIRVSVPPGRPIAADQTATTHQGVSVDIDLARGATGGTATSAFVLPPSPSEGSVELNGLTATFIPRFNFAGETSFEFFLSNNLGSSNFATVRISVAPDPPIVLDQFASTRPSTRVTIDLARGATGGPGRAARLVSAPPPAEGTVEISGLNALFTPAAGFVGESSFSFELSNSAGPSNIATARVLVFVPIDVVTLNPFWSYPSGAASVDLTRIAREINAPGSSPGANPSGPAISTKIASDGVSRLVIGLKTASREPARIALASGSPGSLLPLNTAMFRTAGGSQRSITLSNFAMVPGGDGLMTGGVLYVAPETPPDGLTPRTVAIWVDQGRQSRTLTLDLVPPPVLLVHDLWSGPAAWGGWGDLSRRFPLVDAARYEPGGLAFDAPALQAGLKTKIDAVLETTRRKGIVAAQVNLVGHGMGGLVARVHANDNGRRGPQNFGAGPVNAVVTIDSPHQGTPLAQRLQDNRIRRVVFAPQAVASQPSVFLLKSALSTLASPTLSDYFARVLHKPISGASESLRPGSASLTRLRNGATPFPYEAIATYDNVAVPSELESVLGTFLRALGLPSVDQILGTQNDVIVALASQRSGGNPAPAPFPGLIHSGGSPSSPIVVLNSPLVASYVSCRLLNKSGCREAAAAEPAIARVPVDGFSLSGHRRIADSSLGLSGIPATGLVPNVSRVLTPVSASSARRLTHFLALIDNGDANWFSGDNVDPKIRLTATSLKPITVRIVATFSDRSYASRSFTLRPNTGFAIRSLAFNDPVIRIQRGTTFPLALTAGLTAPAAGSFDVTANATYTPQTGKTGVARVYSNGMIMAVAPGTMWIRGSFKGRNAYTTIIVSP